MRMFYFNAKKHATFTFCRGTMRLLVLFATLVSLVKITAAVNILAVLPIPSKSHHFMFRPIINELGRRGHNVTIVLPYDLYTNSTNVNQLIVHSSAEKFLDTIDFNTVLSLGKAPLFIPPKMSFWFYGYMSCEDYLKSDRLQRLIHSKDDKFDLVILETSFGQESLIGFSHKFKAPVVTLNSNINLLFLDEFIGNPLSLAYVPHSESELAIPMSFGDRLWNAIRSLVVLSYGYYVYLPHQEALMRNHFGRNGSESMPSIIDMLKNNISLAISNSHVSVEGSRPLVPNVIGAAGLHIKDNPEPLTKDLQEYMDKSRHGVIYFSLGTIIPVHKMEKEWKNNLLKAFSKLKQNVIWKANVESMEDAPKNVKVAKWLPQQSVLAHPNCKGFMTHGGLLSLQEAIHFGVPLIGIPIFADQHTNIGRAVNAGFAIKLSHKNITEESIFWAISELVDNKRYRECAKNYSRIFKDNPIDPLDNAIYWIEYVIRHNGARHLRTPKLDLPLFQYLLIDVILFVIFLILTSIAFTYLVLKIVLVNLVKRKIRIFIENKKDE